MMSGTSTYSRRDFLQALGGVALLPLFTHCSSRPLTIASHVWPGYEFMFLAAREGWLPQKDLKLLETSSATDSLGKLREGIADGAALTLDEVLRARADSIMLTAVLVFDESAGADVLIARPDISGLQQLIGKRLGVEQSALGALMLQKVLATAGINQNALTVVSITVDQQLTAWRTGSVDAVITYEPVATQIEAMEGKRIFDSRQIPGAILDVLAVQPASIGKQAGPLRSLVSGHFRARRHFQINHQDASYRMAGRMKLTAQEVLDSYRGLEIPDIRTNRQLLSGKTPRLLESARMLSQIMVNSALLPRPDTLAALVNADFLPREES